MIYELNDFFTTDECMDYINKINMEKNCVPFTNCGQFVNNKWTDPDLALYMFTRLQSYNIQDNILRPNTIIMSGKYQMGDLFSLHTDTGLYYNKDVGEKTKWTLLVYLNDNYEGGETVFYDNSWNIAKVVNPKKGKAILFDIDLWHKGNKIIHGNKYWIGCEIIGVGV